MPVAAQPYALTTPAEFLAYLGEPPDSQGKQTDRAQRLINGYSKAINKYLRRRWKPVEAAVDKIFAYTGNGFLSLAPFEARTVHTITLYTDMPTSGWLVLVNQSATQEA